MRPLHSLIYREKPHYELLDGLRGVAALLVIWYHFFEAFATSGVDQRFNHGYLAVDFFFVLSGFVIGYAYDDRWKNGLTTKQFILRRLIRLQPMVLFAVCLGVLAFVLQGCEHWDHTPSPPWAIAVAFILALFMLPAIPGTAIDVRGNGEMFPLVGPAWSLFFEYLGSILYALVLHRLSTRWLRVFVVFCALGLTAVIMSDMSGSYSIGVGWTLASAGFVGGFMRLGFSFGMGLLMSRRFVPLKIRGAFWLCILIMVLVMCMPYVTFDGHPSMLNGVYDILCTVFVFPLIVRLAASGRTSDNFSKKACSFLGGISYPVYIIHYPFMYIFYAWVWNNNFTFTQVWPVVAVMFVLFIPFAWMVARFYDEPLRRWLGKKLL